MIFLLFRSGTQFRLLGTWRCNRYIFPKPRWLITNLRYVRSQKSKYVIYTAGQTLYQIRQRGREIPISLSCKQGGDLHNQSSQNTWVIWLPLCVVIFTRNLVITWLTTWKHIVLWTMEAGRLFRKANIGLWEKHKLENILFIFFLRIGWRSPSRDKNRGTAWSMPPTHILDLTNGAQWVTGTYKTVESARISVCY
jgi:hypothetical protein